MTDLARRQSTAISLPPSVHLTSKGLMISGMTKPDFMVVGQFLSRVDDATQWAIGDWVNSYDRSYGDLKRICERLGLVYTTVMNCASLGRRFTFSRRREVSFTHHAAVAALEVEDQDRLLDAAEKHNWSVDRLRDRVRAKLQPSDGVDDNLLGDDAGETFPAPETSDPPDDDAVPPAADNGEAEDVMAGASGFDAVLGSVARLKTSLRELAATPAGGMLPQEMTDIEAARVKLYQIVSHCRPFKECVYCSGAGTKGGKPCRACKGRRWLNEALTKQVPKEMRA